MTLTFTVVSVTNTVNAQTVKLNAVKNTATPAPAVLPTPNSYIGIQITDPALYGHFTPGQVVTLTVS